MIGNCTVRLIGENFDTIVKHEIMNCLRTARLAVLDHLRHENLHQTLTGAIK